MSSYALMDSLSFDAMLSLKFSIPPRPPPLSAPRPPFPRAPRPPGFNAPKLASGGTASLGGVLRVGKPPDPKEPARFTSPGLLPCDLPAPNKRPRAEALIGPFAAGFFSGSLDTGSFGFGANPLVFTFTARVGVSFLSPSSS